MDGFTNLLIRGNLYITLKRKGWMTAVSHAASICARMHTGCCHMVLRCAPSFIAAIKITDNFPCALLVLY